MTFLTIAPRPLAVRNTGVPSTLFLLSDYDIFPHLHNSSWSEEAAQVFSDEEEASVVGNISSAIAAGVGKPYVV